MAPLQATLARLEVTAGDIVRRGQTLAILEAMKMEHVLAAPFAGEVALVSAEPGAILAKDQVVIFVIPSGADQDEAPEARAVDPDHIRPDLAAVLERWKITRDAARPEAVARRRARNQRTARENIDDLVDPGSFLEYGAFALAAQRRRRSEEELLKMRSRRWPRLRSRDGERLLVR